MAAYFQLYRMNSTEATPVKFSTVDEEICAHFMEAVHDTRYYHGWYDTIGFLLAVGRDHDYIDNLYNGKSDLPHGDTIDWQHGREINDFIRKNYKTNAWFAR